MTQHDRLLPQRTGNGIQASRKTNSFVIKIIKTIKSTPTYYTFPRKKALNINKICSQKIKITPVDDKTTVVVINLGPTKFMSKILITV